MRVSLDLQDDDATRFGKLHAEIDPREPGLVVFFISRGPTDPGQRFTVATCELRALLAALDAVKTKA